MKKSSARPTSLAVILLLAALVSLLIFGLSRLRLDGFSNFIAELMQGGRDGAVSPDSAAYGELFVDLAEPAPDTPRLLDAVSLTEAFAQFPFAETYEHHYTVTYSDGTRANTQCVSLTREGKRYQVLIFDGENVDPNALLLSATSDGSTCAVRDSMGNQHLYLSDESFPLSSVAMLPDTDTFCRLLRDYEADPAASPLSACTAVVEDSSHGRMLILRFTERDSGREEEYRYLLDYGILHAATSTQDGLVYYELKTIAFSTEVSMAAAAAAE